MDAAGDAVTTGVERLNALLAWWGVPSAAVNGEIDAQTKRFQQFVADLQKTCGEAYSGQMDALLTNNDRLMRAFQGLLSSRRPQEVVAAESDILSTFLEGASLHAKKWGEVTQKLQDCYAAMARAAAEDLRHQPQETTPATPAGAEQRSARQPSKPAAQA
jgi:hypothetical protein